MTEANILPGYRSHGWGPVKIIVLHDWISDGSGYEPLLPYLDPALCQWVFMDLRGYGLSRGLPASHTLDEAAGDVLALADRLDWPHFHLVGHSMSGLVIQKVAVLAPGRLDSLVAITPVGPQGQPLDAGIRQMLKAMARERTVAGPLRAMWGGRLSESWFQFKLRRWRETADAEASAAYVDMFSGPGLADAVAGFARPILVIAGGQDAGPFAEAALRAAFEPLYPALTLRTIADAGHYPMQECPALLATLVERFVLGGLDAASGA